MSKQILGSDKILRINNYPLLGLVQSHDATPNFNPQDIDELGNQGRVDTAYEIESNGSLELESSGNTPGLLARMIPVRSGGAFTKYLYSGLGANTNKNQYTITEADVSEMQFDLVEYARPDQVNFSHSRFFPRCFPASVSGRIDANGMANETVAWQAQEFYGFDSPYHDIVATAATVATSTTATLLDTSVTSTSYTLIYFWVNETRYRTSVSGDAVYASFATSTVTLNGGDTIPSDAICRAVFYKTASPSTNFPQLVSAQRGTVAFYVKGWQADIFLNAADIDNPTNDDRLLRVQSADYSIDFNLQPLRQIAKNTAGTSIYCRVPTTPYAVSLNCSMYESDWSEWFGLLKTGGTNPKFPASGNNVYTDSYDYAPDNLKGDLANPITAVLRYYTKQGNVLQTLQMSDLRIDSHPNRVNVGGRAEVTVGLRGTKFKFIGANPTA